MKKKLNRREAMKTMALAAGAASVGLSEAFGMSPSKIKIGYTCITWGTFPLKPSTGMRGASCLL